MLITLTGRGISPCWYVSAKIQCDKMVLVNLNENYFRRPTSANFPMFAS